MDIIVVSLVALIASCLTFFSGFGLGTILMPAFLIFFPIETAIALTAVVHLLNNILKVVILWKKAEWPVVLKFGLPAFITAFIGAKLLFALETIPPLHQYTLFGKEMIITPVKLVIAALIGGFAVLEVTPRFEKITFPPQFLPAGGSLSGFFGGLSGHQGALRSMFLLKCGLTKEQFIATGVIIACLVDFSRIAVYWNNLMSSQFKDHLPIMLSAVAFAFAGVFLGSRLLKKITMKTVQMIVSVMLFLIAVLLAAGVI